MRKTKKEQFLEKIKSNQEMTTRQREEENKKERDNMQLVDGIEMKILQQRACVSRNKCKDLSLLCNKVA